MGWWRTLFSLARADAIPAAANWRAEKFSELASQNLKNESAVEYVAFSDFSTSSIAAIAAIERLTANPTQGADNTAPKIDGEQSKAEKPADGLHDASELLGINLELFKSLTDRPRAAFGQFLAVCFARAATPQSFSVAKAHQIIANDSGVLDNLPPVVAELLPDDWREPFSLAGLNKQVGVARRKLGLGPYSRRAGRECRSSVTPDQI
jgi:hypothetical protein